MRVTEVKVFPVADEKLKAFVSVVLDDCFMINDIKIIEGKDGCFISMPSRRKRNGKFKDIAHPLNSETRQMLESEILDTYESASNGDGDGERQRSLRRRQAQVESQVSPSMTAEVSGSNGGADGPEASTLEEVTEKHLSDTFWTS